MEQLESNIRNPREGTDRILMEQLESNIRNIREGTNRTLMEQLESNIRNLREGTDRILKGCGPFASPEAIECAAKEVKYSTTFEARSELRSTDISLGIEPCCELLSLFCILAVFGIAALITAVALLLLLISTVISLVVFKHDNAKYLYAGVAALVILGIWAGAVYKIYYEPMSSAKKDRKNTKEKKDEYGKAVRDYKNAIKTFEARGEIVTNMSPLDENDILIHLNNRLAQDLDESDIELPNPGRLEYGSGSLEPSQNFKSIDAQL